MKLSVKQRMAMAAAAGVMTAAVATAAPLLNLQVQESASLGGSYSNTLVSVSPGGTIYFQVVALSAAGNVTTNSHSGSTTPNGSSDSFNDLSAFTLTDESGTFASATMDVTGGTGDGATIIGGSSLSVKAVYGGGTYQNDDTAVVLVNGTITAGSGTGIILATNNLGSAASGTFKVEGSLLAESATTENSADPYLGFVPLTSGLVWSGATNSNWDTSTANFSGSTYTDNSSENVNFGDKASDNATEVQNTSLAASVVIQNGGVSPGVVTFDNKVITYTLSDSASAGIGGSAGVFIGGGGTVIFSGPNSYTGGTTIANGTLQAVNGSLPGQVTIGALGKLTLGTSGATPSALTTGNQTWTAGGSYAPRVNGGAGGAADLLDIGSGGNGTLTLSGSGAFTIAPQSGNTTLGSTSENWEIAAFNSTISGYSGTLPSGTGVSSGVAVDSQFALDTSAFSAPSSDFSLSLVSLGGGDDALYLNYTPTPEPATIILSLGAAAPILLGRRRRIGANRM